MASHAKTTSDEKEAQHREMVMLRREVSESGFKIEDLQYELKEKDKKLAAWSNTVKAAEKLMVKYKLLKAEKEEMSDVFDEHKMCAEKLAALEARITQLEEEKRESLAIDDKDEGSDKVRRKEDEIKELKDQIREFEKEMDDQKMLVSELTEDLANKADALQNCGVVLDGAKSEYEAKITSLQEQVVNLRHELQERSFNFSGTWLSEGNLYRPTNIGALTPGAETMDVVIEIQLKECQAEVEEMKRTWKTPQQWQEFEQAEREMKEKIEELHTLVVERDRELCDLHCVKQEYETCRREVERMGAEIVNHEKERVAMIAEYEREVANVKTEVGMWKSKILEQQASHMEEMRERKEECERRERECEETCVKEKEEAWREMTAVKGEMEEKMDRKSKELKEFEAKLEMTEIEFFNEKSKLNSNAELLKETIKEMETKEVKLEDEIVKYNQELERLEEVVVEKNQAIADYRESKDSMDVEMDRLREVEERYEVMKSDCISLNKELDAINSKNREMEAAQIQSTNEVRALLNKIERLEVEKCANISNHEKVLAGVRQEHEKEMADLRTEMEGNMKDLVATNKIREAEIEEQMRQKEVQSQAEVKFLKSEISEGKLKVEQLSEEVKEMRQAKCDTEGKLLEVSNRCALLDSENFRLMEKESELMETIENMQKNEDKLKEAVRNTDEMHKLRITELERTIYQDSKDWECEKTTMEGEIVELKHKLVDLSHIKLTLEEKLVGKDLEIGKIREYHADSEKKIVEQKEAERESMSARYECLQNVVDEMRAKYDDQVKSLVQKHTANLDVLKKELDSKIQASDGEKVELANMVSELERKLEAQAQSLVTIKMEKNVAEQQNNKLEDQMKIMGENLTKLEEKKVVFDEEMCETKHRLAEREKDLQKVSVENTEHRQKIKHLEGERGRLMEEKEEVSKQMESSVRSGKEREELLVDQLNRQIKISREKDDSINSIQKNVKEKEEEIKGKEKSIADKDKKCCALEMHVTKLEEHNLSMEGKIKVLVEKLENQESVTATLEKDVKKLTAEKQRIQSSSDKMRESLNMKQEQFDKIKEKNEKIKQSMTQLETKLFNQSRDLHSQLTSRNTELESKTRKISLLEENVDKINVKVIELERELSQVKISSQGEIHGKEQEALRMDQELAKLGGEHSRLGKELHDKEKKYQMLQKTVEEAEEKEEMLKNKINDEKVKWEAEKKKLLELCEQYVRDKDQMQTSYKLFKQSSQGKLQKFQASVKSEQDQFHSNLKMEQTKRLEMEQQYTSEHKRVEELMSELKKCKEMLMNAEKESVVMNREKLEAEREAIRLRTAIDHLQLQKSGLESKNKTLQNQMSGFQSPDYSKIKKLAGKPGVPKSPGILWQDLSVDGESPSIQTISSSSHLGVPPATKARIMSMDGDPRVRQTLLVSGTKHQPASFQVPDPHSRVKKGEEALTFNRAVIPYNRENEEPEDMSMTWLSIQSSSDISKEIDDGMRLTELQRRNTMQPSHLKSCYPLEVTGLEKVGSEKTISHGSSTADTTQHGERKREADDDEEEQCEQSPKKKTRLFAKLHGISTPLKRKGTGSTPMKLRGHGSSSKKSTSSDDSISSVSSTKSKRGITFTVPSAMLKPASRNKGKKGKR